MLTKVIILDKLEIDRYGNTFIRFSLDIVDDEDGSEYHKDFHRVGLSKTDSLVSVTNSLAPLGFGSPSDSDLAKIGKILDQIKQVEFQDPPESDILQVGGTQHENLPATPGTN